MIIKKIINNKINLDHIKIIININNKTELYYSKIINKSKNNIINLLYIKLIIEYYPILLFCTLSLKKYYKIIKIIINV